MDSAASHNITDDIVNLSIHSEYDGTNEVIFGDDSSLSVSHIGSLTLKYPKKKLFYVIIPFVFPFMQKFDLCVSFYQTKQCFC